MALFFILMLVEKCNQRCVNRRITMKDWKMRRYLEVCVTLDRIMAGTKVLVD